MKQVKTQEKKDLILTKNVFSYQRINTSLVRILCVWKLLLIYMV